MAKCIPNPYITIDVAEAETGPPFLPSGAIHGWTVMNGIGLCSSGSSLQGFCIVQDNLEGVWAASVL